MRIGAMLFKRPRTGIKRLLVVEDEPLVAFDNEYFLTTEGYEVVATVDNAAEALALLATHNGTGAGAGARGPGGRNGWQSIDAVLLDINLADGQSGIDVARAAQALGVAVLFLAGSIPEGAADVAIAALAKPYGQRDLAAALKAVDSIVAGRSPGGVPSSVRLFG
jgi:DNA-binding response OmpR family regulator